jgi:hypothetical protein
MQRAARPDHPFPSWSFIWVKESIVFAAGTIDLDQADELRGKCPLCRNSDQIPQRREMTLCANSTCN